MSQNWGPPQYPQHPYYQHQQQPPQRPPPKPISGWKTMLVGILPFIALAIAIDRCSCGEPYKPPPKTAQQLLEDRCGEHLRAGDCQDMMRRRLRFPESAEFESVIFGEHVVTNPDCSQTYSSHVVSKNAFGVPIRNTFMCRFDPKTRQITLTSSGQ